MGCFTRTAFGSGLAVLLLAPGCASLISGTTQRVHVSSTPPGARVTAEPGGFTATTPGDLTLPRSKAPFILTFKKERFAPAESRLESGLNGWIWGNLLLGGLVGILVDFGTGAAYALSPSEVHVNLVGMADGP